MESIPIARLTPELADIELKQFKAVVTLIWPFSSSTRQCAVLLADPDFRLRSKRGQVRVRFTGSSARAVAETGISYGDEVVLSLRGAQFVEGDKDKDVNTPGKSVDWELSYAQTVVVQISRDGELVANLEILNVAPTPAPSSPVRQQTIETPVTLPALRAPGSEAQRWTSPAFLKHKRLSDGPFFEAGYDPLVQQNGEEPDKKRRRKSYRDWKAWTYSARTPSPEPVETDVDEVSDLEASPTRATTLPETPISSPKPDPYSAASLRSKHSERDSTVTQKPLNAIQDDGTGIDNNDGKRPAHIPFTDDFVRDADYYDLYAGPGESPPNITHNFGGDTVSNTEENTPEPPEKIVNASEASHSLAQDAEIISSSEEEEDALYEEVGKRDDGKSSHEWPEVQVDPMILDEAPEITMPPPTLPSLQTNFHLGQPSGFLTPTGREPQSPVLKPQDSSMLPMPSPFPGERDGAASSYLDAYSPRLPHSPAIELQNQQLNNENETDVIAESSFYSSGSTWNIPDTKHESAFTDVRFTFGMDGSTYSHPRAESQKPEELSGNSDLRPTAQGDGLISYQDTTFQYGLPGQHTSDIFDHFTADDSQMGLQEPNFTLHTEEERIDEQSHPPHLPLQDHSKPDTIMLSSGSESESVRGDMKRNDYDDFIGIDVGDERRPEGRPHEEKLRQAADRRSPNSTKALETEEPSLVPVTERAEAGTSLVESPVVIQPVASTFVHTVPPMQATPEVIDLGSPSDDEGEYENQDESDLRESNRIIQLEQELSFPTDQATPKVSADIGTSQESNMRGEHFEAGIATGGDVLNDSQNDAYSQEDRFIEIPETLDHHPDIKMESIEEDNNFSMEHDNITHREAEDVASVSGPSADMLIQVPGEGHKVGELQWQAVSSTGPARNTRSKTKASLSPTRTENDTAQTRTRSMRSKTSLTSVSRDTVSPTKTRLRSTASPLRDPMTTSPSLRSHSKMRSPAQIPSTAPETRSSRKRNGTFGSDVSTSPLQGSFSQQETSNAGLAPSVEPGTLGSSQGKFSNASFVNDTEEGSLDSENSVAIEPNSDDHNGYHIDKFPSSKNAGEGEVMNEIIPKARKETNEVNYPSVPFGSFEKKNVPTSSSPPPHADHRSHTRRTNTTPRTVQSMQTPGPDQQLSLANSNMPLTPQATQSSTQSQSSLQPDQQEQTLPMTPQLTQTSPTRLLSKSFHSDVEIEESSHERLAERPVDGPTSHRSTTSLDVASPEHSQSVRSGDISNSSESESQLAKQLEPPSVGFSTPISYYTPLRDLSYFMNRSSQFHSSSNPDVLALVTSNTTLPKKAEKGPKQWNTSLHITDLSLFPESRSVQVFRAYSSALPIATTGDIILLHGFNVRSQNRKPMLLSTEESAWCVWRYSKPIWGTKRTAFGEIRAREEVKGPAVERGEGEWKEVERLRGWYVSTAKAKLEEIEESTRKTRSHDKELPSSEGSQRETRSKGKAKVSGLNGAGGANGEAGV